MKSKIVIPKRLADNSTYTVALTPKAASMLRALASQTSMSVKQLTSTIIVQAVSKNLISLEDDDDDDEGGD